MTRLTEELRQSLGLLSRIKGGWVGMRPGSNFWAMTELRLDEARGLKVPGEHIDALERMGLLSAEPIGDLSQAFFVIKGGDCGDYGHIPDIDLEFDWSVSPAGRARLRGEGSPDIPERESERRGS